MQFLLKYVRKEEMIRLRRVLPKTLRLYLSKMTVPIRFLINSPATLHSEGSSVHLGFPGFWHGAEIPARWESLSVSSWKYVTRIGTQGSCMAMHSNGIFFFPLTTYSSQSAGG